MSQPTRAEDERLLAMLAQRDDGVSATEIGARFGITAHSVRKAFRKVTNDFDQSSRKD